MSEVARRRIEEMRRARQQVVDQGSGAGVTSTMK